MVRKQLISYIIENHYKLTKNSSIYEKRDTSSEKVDTTSVTTRSIKLTKKQFNMKP
jgi:hypothetical protein